MQPVGCYLATPAFTYSAVGQRERERERGGTAWAVVRLRPNGVALRPLLPAMSDRRSTWMVHGDTLHLTLFDGMVGWQAALRATSSGWAGPATYLSDAIAVGRPPTQRIFVLTRRKCGAKQNAKVGRPRNEH